MGLLENIEKQFTEVSNTNVVELRKNAFTAFEKLGIPSSRHEEWKYTNIKTKLNEQLSLTPVDSQVNAAVKNYIASLPPYSFRIIFLNGVFHPELSIVPDTKGLTVCSLKEAFISHAALVEKHFGKLVNYNEEHFAALNTAFVNDGVFVHAQKNVTVNEPIYVQYFFTASEVNAFTQTRSLAIVEEGGSIQIAEDFPQCQQHQS